MQKFTSYLPVDKKDQKGKKSSFIVWKKWKKKDCDKLWKNGFYLYFLESQQQKPGFKPDIEHWPSRRHVFP